MAIEYARMRQLTGSAADWVANDLVLGLGEIGFSSDAGVTQGKVGDGSSKFSELPFTISTASVPLTGTVEGQPVTGAITFKSDAVNKQFFFGIFEGFGVDDLLIAASGDNTIDSNIWFSVNGNNWTMTNTGRLLAPDITYVAEDELALVNKKYVDDAVAGGVSGSYIPLTGTAGNPVTGLVEFQDAAINKDYTFGILDDFGFQDLILTAAGSNKLNCSFFVLMNDYVFGFLNSGRLQLPDITYTGADGLAAVNKNYVDDITFTTMNNAVADVRGGVQAEVTALEAKITELRAELIALGVAVNP